MFFSSQVLLALFATAVAILYQYFPRESRYNITTDYIKDAYDYIVVGGGSAGSVVASRLSEDSDRTVLLLEAGGHFDEGPFVHPPMLWATLQRTQYDWGYYTEPQTQAFQGFNGQKGFYPRGRILGGTSVLNAMQYTRGSSFDFDQWAADECDGWSFKDVLPYFLKSEDIQIDSLKTSPYHSSGGPLAVSYSEPTGLTEYFLKAGEELGYSINDYNGKYQEGFSAVQSSLRDGVRSSTGLEFLGKIGKRENLNIAVRTMVTKIDIQDNRAVGVYYVRNNKKYYVSARKEVILSSGAINSPQILMLSGIGPREDLEKVGIEVLKDLQVGKYLKDHQCVVLPTSINKPYSITRDQLLSQWSKFRYDWFQSGPLALTGLDGSAFLHIDKSKQGKTYPDIQVIFLNFLFSDNIFNLDEKFLQGYFASDPNMHGFTTAICLTHPYSTGSVKLKSADPYDHPLIDPQFFSDRRDIDQMIAGIRIWEKMTKTKAFRDLGVDVNQLKVPFCSEHEFRTDKFWECFIRHVGLTEYHHSCTCRMGGDNDPLAVVDPQLKVKGIEGLRVVDASAFHNVTSGNTNAPTIMLAEKAADMIRGKDTVKMYREKLKQILPKSNE